MRLTKLELSRCSQSQHVEVGTRHRGLGDPQRRGLSLWEYWSYRFLFWRPEDPQLEPFDLFDKKYIIIPINEK